jgi:hypothetical protein
VCLRTCSGLRTPDSRKEDSDPGLAGVRVVGDGVDPSTSGFFRPIEDVALRFSGCHGVPFHWVCELPRDVVKSREFAEWHLEGTRRLLRRTSPQASRSVVARDLTLTGNHMLGIATTSGSIRRGGWARGIALDGE